MQWEWQSDLGLHCLPRKLRKITVVHPSARSISKVMPDLFHIIEFGLKQNVDVNIKTKLVIR